MDPREGEHLFFVRVYRVKRGYPFQIRCKVFRLFKIKQRKEGGEAVWRTMMR
jgi:hypothetical protein